MKEYVSPVIEIREFKNEEVLTGSENYYAQKPNETPIIFNTGKLF